MEISMEQRALLQASTTTMLAVNNRKFQGFFSRKLSDEIAAREQVPLASMRHDARMDVHCRSNLLF